MGKIKDKLKNLEIRLIGNRANLVGGILLATTIAYSCTQIEKNHAEFSHEGEPGSVGIIEASKSDYNPTLSDLAEFTVCVFGFILGGSILFGTRFGDDTLRLYKRTKRHIEKFGGIDSNFGRKLMDSQYCDKQGMYLATRDYGNLEEFKELERDNSRVIPHF